MPDEKKKAPPQKNISVKKDTESKNPQNTEEEVPNVIPANSLQNLDEFFSNSMRRILIFANEEARKVHAEDIDTEHLLMGILRNAEKDAVLHQIFEKMEIDVEALKEETKKEIREGNNKNPAKFLPFSVRTKNILIQADVERRKLRHHATAGEHLLVALSKGDGVAAKILKKHEITQEPLENQIKNVVGVGQKKDVLVNEYTPMLDKYGVDLCQMAREGKVDPVIGRSDEIERTIHILARRRKNNPLLIGEPGVGKTAIAEGLANRIVRGDVPDVLKGKRIIAIAINTIVAGASKRGEFEQRLEGIVKEAIKSSGEIILFVDEIHTLISSSGSGDAAQILKPPLARGEIHLIGATTTAEHHEHIEKDAAFARRFQTVFIAEPSFDETLQILQGSRDKYEAFHKVKISDDILRMAITLSMRYISNRFLPDKAFDLIDEAAAMARMPGISAPGREKKLQKEIQKLRAEQERAKGVVNIEELTRLEQNINEKVKKLEEVRAEHEDEQSRSHDEIKEEHLSRVISRWSGVPMEHIAGSEANRLLKLEDVLHKRLIGQDYAVKAVSAAIRRGRSGIRKPKRPIGSFLFMGPSGVGKTEFAKTLAETLFGRDDLVIRFDMSEFMEKHAVARLTGPPPGYVGYEKGGELTEAVRKQPYSIVLMDEVEKAHPAVFHILLQILDDGRLTDNHGRLVGFKHTIIICTSNLASRLIAQKYAEFWKHNEGVEEEMKREEEKIAEDVKDEMKTEDEKGSENSEKDSTKESDKESEASGVSESSEEENSDSQQEASQDGKSSEKSSQVPAQEENLIPPSKIPPGTVIPGASEKSEDNDFLKNFITPKE